MPNKKLVKQTIDFTKGLTPYSGILVKDGGSPDCKNVELYRGELRRSVGLTELTSTVVTDELPLGLFEFYTSSGTNRLLLLTDTSNRQYNAGAWDSKGALGTPLTVNNNPDLYVSACVANDLFVKTDSVNNPQKYTGTGNFADLDGIQAAYTSFLAEEVINYYQYVVFGSTTENGVAYPTRLRWSDTDAPETWGSNNSGGLDIKDTPDRILRMRMILDTIFVFKGSSIHQVSYVGYPNIFYPSPIQQQGGLLARKSLVDYYNSVIGLFLDGIYIFNGRTMEDITKELYPLLFGVNSEMDMDAAANSVGVYVPDLNEYWIAIPLSGETVPTNIFRYNLKTGAWWRKDTGVPVYCAGSWEEDTVDTWATVGDGTTTWAEMTAIWDAKQLGAGQKLHLFGTENSDDAKVLQMDAKVISDDGTIQPSYYTTKDYSFAPSTRYGWIWIEAKGSGSLTLDYSIDGGSTWISRGTKTIQTSFKLLKFSLNFTAENVRFRFTLPEVELSIREVILWYRERER